MPDLLASRYRIDSSLGAGGMGEVLLAQDTLLERRVAIKVLPTDVQTDPNARGRLRREALAAASLDHPFICKVYEIGDAEGRLSIAMEYVEGETLHVVARRALLPMRQVVEMATELAEALEEAHRRGVVHRDLKPANVMITPQGHVKVMDFGLAKPLAPDSGADVGSDAATRLTESGARWARAGYMSPEQVLGGPLDPRSDIFSLGVILHELATGRHPFLRDDPTQTTRKHRGAGHQTPREQSRLVLVNAIRHTSAARIELLRDVDDHRLAWPPHAEQRSVTSRRNAAATRRKAVTASPFHTRQFAEQWEATAPKELSVNEWITCAKRTAESRRWSFWSRHSSKFGTGAAVRALRSGQSAI